MEIASFVNARVLVPLGLCATLAGCLSPRTDARLGDRFPTPLSQREGNPEWQHVEFRPFSTYGLNERVTGTSLAELAKGVRDFGHPQP